MIYRPIPDIFWNIYMNKDNIQLLIKSLSWLRLFVLFVVFLWGLIVPLVIISSLTKMNCQWTILLLQYLFRLSFVNIS